MGTVSYEDKIGQPDIVVYTPNPNASGADLFTYQITDGKAVQITQQYQYKYELNPRCC